MYKCDENKSMSGMRVKLTFTFSAMGTCFPLVCTVSGLTEREMLMGEEFIHIRVPGLCIGGGVRHAVDPLYLVEPLGLRCRSGALR